MPVLKVNQNGEWKDIASSSSHIHLIEDITDLPNSLVGDVEALKDKVGSESVAWQIDAAVKAMGSASSYEHPLTHPASMITGLAKVATSGSYNDLTDLPTGGGGVSSWNDLTDKPFGEDEDGSVTQLDNKYLSIVEDEKIKAEYLPDNLVTDTEMENAIANIDIPDAGVSSWNDLADRPFYDSRIEILAEQTLEGFTEYKVISTNTTMGSFVRDSVDFELVVGVEYTVFWDEQEYILTAVATSYELVPAMLGNACLLDGEDTGEPFLLYSMPTQGRTTYRSIDATATSHSVAVYQGSPTIKMLDNKYLSILEDEKIKFEYIPDTVVTETELEEAIANIDIGVSSWNDLTDRPGGYTETYPELTYTFDGNLDGKELYADQTDGSLRSGYVRIGPPCPFKHMRNTMISHTVYSNGQEETSTEDGRSVDVNTLNDEYGVYEASGMMLFERDTPYATMGIEQDGYITAGLYVVYYNMTDSEGNITFEMYVKEMVIHATEAVTPFENKYLNILNYFPRTETETDILPLITYDGFEFNSYYGVYARFPDDTFTLTIGETYVIYWDGETYECVAQDVGSMLTDYVAVGNATGFGFSGNGEPFLIGANSITGETVFAALTDGADGGSHDVRIYQVEVADEHYKLKPKFIDNIPWDKIADRPFGDIATGAIVLEETVTTGSYGQDGDTDITQLSDLKSCYIVKDASYTVTMNGTQYFGTGAIDNGIKGIIITDAAATQIGAVIANYNDSYDAFITINSVIPSGTRLDVRITLAEDIVATLDSKYLPEDLSGLPEVTTDDNDKVLTVVDGAWVVGNYNLTGLATESYVDEKVAAVTFDQIQADWDEQDVSSDAYIRNRPFGYLPDVLKEFTCEFTYSETYDCYYAADANFSLEEGVYYSVVWDGVSYICQAKWYTYTLSGSGASGTTTWLALGDPTIVGGRLTIDAPSTGEPFIISNNNTCTSSTDSAHTFSIVLEDNVARLGYEWLPEDIATEEYVDEAIANINVSGSGGLPEVTTDDAGKFLRVSSAGTWAVEAIPNAEGASF